MKNKEHRKAASIKSNTKHAKKLLRKDKGKGVRKAKQKFQKVKRNDRGEMFDPKFKEELEKGDDIEIDYDDMMEMIDREDGDDNEMSDKFEQQWMEKTKKLETIKEAKTKKEISAQKRQDKAKQQAQKLDDDEEDEPEEEEEEEDKKSKNIAYDKLDNLSYLESLVIVKQKKEELRDTLAQLSNAIMEHPELNIRKMNKLLALMDLDNTDPQFGLIFLSVQTLTCQSICLVLCDIVPNFRYSERFRKETADNKLKLKKDTIKVQEYEKSVVQFYQLYMKRLVRMVDATVPSGTKSNKTKSNFIKTMVSSPEARQQVCVIAINCLARMLEAHPNFNYGEQIMDILAKVFCNTSKDSHTLRAICGQAFKRLFQTDTLGECTLKAITMLSDRILENNFRVDPSVFRSFSYVDLRELAQDIEAVKQRQLGAVKSKREKKDRKVMSRKERKNAKKMGKLEKELLEAEATESRDRIMENKVEIHKKLFALYFRFLKRCAEVDEVSADSQIDDLHLWYTPIFCVMFDDIAKFSVYLNDIYVYELIELMLKMINSHGGSSGDNLYTNGNHQEVGGAFDSEVGTLQGVNKLRCLKAIFKILSLTDHSLNIDFHQPYNILYEACGDSRIVLTDSWPVLLECFNEMVLKQHKLLSQKRMIAFSQRIFSILPYLMGSDAQKLIETLNKLFALVPSLAETLFDSEEVLENAPTRQTNKKLTMDTAGILPCSIFELGSLMRVHSNQRIRKFAGKLLELP